MSPGLPRHVVDGDSFLLVALAKVLARLNQLLMSWKKIHR